MKFSQKQILKKSLVLLSILIFIIGCNEETTPLIPPSNENAIEINFPIGKKAIYARGDYMGDNPDSLTEMLLSIYSLQFDTVIAKDNSVEYLGVVEYYSAPFVVNDSLPLGMYPGQYESGRVLVTVDDKWVLFQNSEVMNASMIFLKRDGISTDTTDFPNWLYGQFPVFPSIVSPNSSYSIVRPGNKYEFIEIKRDFDVMDYIEWNDIYSSDIGLHYSTEYFLNIEDGFTLNFSGIIDEKGIVLSRTIIDDVVIGTMEYPDGIDTTSLYLINRRIVDFTNPDYTYELSWYSDYVKENGLTFLKDK